MSRRRKPCPKAPKRPKVLPGDLYNCTLPFLGAKVSIDHRNPSRSIAGTVQGCRKKASGRGSEVVVGKTFPVGTVKRALGLSKPRTTRTRRTAAGRAPQRSTEIVLARPRAPMLLPRAMELPRYMLEPRAERPMPPAPRPVLALPAPVYVPPAAPPSTAPGSGVKKRGVKLSQRDRVVLSKAEPTGELYLPNLGPDDTKAAQSLLKRGFFERKNGNVYRLTDLGRDFAETPDAVRADPGEKRWNVITAEPTWMTVLTPPTEVQAPPPPRPVAPPPAAPQGGARLLPVTAAPPAFDVRPSLAGGKVQHYIMWERVTMPDGTLSWVERPWIANDAETLREDIPEKLAQRLAATRASGYSVAAYDRLLGLLQAAFDARGLPARPEGRALFAKELANAIVTGKYTTALDPQNKTTRDVFAKFTGIELPKQQGKTMAMFTGQPFHVVEGIFSEGPSAATAAPTFDEKEWRRFYYGLAGKLLAAAQADLAAARKRGDEGARYEADRQVQAAGQLRKLATNEDVSFARLNATWHSTWADVGIPRAPADAMSQPVSPLPAGMKANRSRRSTRPAFTRQRW